MLHLRLGREELSMTRLSSSGLFLCDVSMPRTPELRVKQCFLKTVEQLGCHFSLRTTSDVQLIRRSVHLKLHVVIVGSG